MNNKHHPAIFSFLPPFLLNLCVNSLRDLTNLDLSSQFDLGCPALTSYQSVLFLCRKKVPLITHFPLHFQNNFPFPSKTIIITLAAYATVN